MHQRDNEIPYQKMCTNAEAGVTATWNLRRRRCREHRCSVGTRRESAIRRGCARRRSELAQVRDAPGAVAHLIPLHPQPVQHRQEQVGHRRAVGIPQMAGT